MSFPRPTEPQARILWAALTGLGVAVLLGLLGLLIWAVGLGLSILAPVLWPLAIAGILACLLDPVVAFFERHKVPRGRAIWLVFLLCLGLLGGVLGSVVPRLVYETRNLIEQVPAYSQQLQGQLNRWLEQKPGLREWRQRLFPAAPRPAPAETNQPVTTPAAPPAAPEAAVPKPAPATGSEPDWMLDYAEAVLQWLAAVLPKVGQWLLAQLSRIASWAGMVIGLALVPVFVYYFLLEKSKIEANWTDYLPLRESKAKEELVFILSQINNYLVVFFRGQVLIAICNGILLSVGFLALGLNYAVLVGLLAGALSIIPYLGTILTIVPTVVLAVVQFQDWLHPLLVVAVYAVVHLLESLFIGPKIMGDRVGLHPLTIIVALLVGTTLLGGILGGILAIPITAALRVLMFRYVWRRRTGAASA